VRKHYQRQGYNDIMRMRAKQQVPKKTSSEVWAMLRDLLFSCCMLFLAAFLIVILASIKW